MMTWQQQKEGPLFPNLLWSRPENKRSAGKLLIIGGQAGQFKSVVDSYEAAVKAGAGTVKVLLPDSLQKLTEHLPNIEYAPSNTSGSFSKKSLGMFNEMSDWADHVLLAGDFGENSETVTILDGYLLRCPQNTTINNQAFASLTLPIDQLSRRPLCLMLDETKIGKLPLEFGITKAITSATNVMEFAEIITLISEQTKASFVILRQNKIWISVGSEVTSTDFEGFNLNKLSAYFATWLMQQPNKPLEALTTACYEALSNK